MSPIPIRVGFSTTSHWTSRLIRWFTNAVVSHAWLLYFDDDFECECVLEFTEGGCRITTYEGFKKRNQIVKVWTPTKPLRAGFVQMAAHLEEGYDYLGLCGMAWVALGRWLKQKWRNPWASSSKAFCSEAVVQVLVWAEYPGLEHTDPHTTSPEDLLQFAMREEIRCPFPV